MAGAARMNGAGRPDWRLPRAAGPAVRDVAGRHRIDLLLAAVLVRRGVTAPDQVAAFLARSPAPAPPLAGMRAAVELISGCRGKPVYVFGDPDVDGIAATAIMVELLRSAGAQVRWRVPAGGRHGLRAGDLQRAQEAGAGMLVCVDCTIGPADAAQAARSGAEVLVVDHHRPLDGVPKTAVVLNPAVSGGGDSERRLAAGGVALRLAEAVRAAADGPCHAAASELPYDLAALSTLADRMPLTGENRCITARGLAMMARSGRLGLQELWLRVGRSAPAPTAEQVSRLLNPVIGSAGRYGEGDHAVALLVSDTHAECADLADRLQELNARRRSETADAWNRLVPKARRLERDHPDARCLVVDDLRLARGLAGPLAFRLSRLLRRSVAVVTCDEGSISGSIRSPDDGHDALRLLAEADGLLATRGGHRSAAGFVAPAGALADLRRRWSGPAGARLGKRGDAGAVRFLDAELPSRGLTPALDRLVAAFEPTGIGNAPLVLRTRGLQVAEVSLFGRASEHCKLLLDAGRYRWPALFWGAGAAAGAGIVPGDVVDVVYRLEPDYADGQRRLRMVVLDLAPIDAQAVGKRFDSGGYPAMMGRRGSRRRAAPAGREGG